METANHLAYSPTTAAKVAEVSRPTIYRWMHIPCRSHRRVYAHPGGGVQALAESAGGGERECMTKEKPLPVFQHRQGQREKVCRPDFPRQILPR